MPSPLPCPRRPFGIASLLAAALLVATPGSASGSTPAPTSTDNLQRNDRPPTAPFRFLLVPIRGTIGVDVTASGVATCLALARSEGWDGVLLEFDTTLGRLDDGLAIANAIRLAADDLRTIALIRTTGGAAILPLFACEEWLVLDEIEIQERDDRGIVVLRPVGDDRSAIRTLPTWGGDAETVVAELSALRTAGRRSMPSTISEKSRDGRAALLDALVDPTLALRVEPGDVVRTIGPDANSTDTAPVIRTGDRGPGISVAELDATGLATGLPVGLDPLRITLGVESVEPQADTGVVLIGSDADERFALRGGLSRQADMIFTSIDAMGSLNAGLPWSVERARLSAPDRPARRGQYPMSLDQTGWRLSEVGLKNWIIGCDQCIRRWNGVANTTRELLALEERGRTALATFEALTPLPEDVARHAGAIRVARSVLDSMSDLLPEWRRLAAIARENIERMEAMRSSPPRIDR
ncbi:MAG: hypothetical protein CMJ27_12755 [Phycisphaerae bacterium]|nr:hypothetical protein [Phycisphaerae bacterium]